MKYVTPGTVTAVLSLAAMLAAVFGKPALSTFFNDPTTAQAVIGAVGAVGTLVAGILKGVHPTA